MPTTNRQRRVRPRPRVESLEARTLLSGAGTLDPSFGGGTGYSQLPLGLIPIASNENYATVQSVAVEPGGQIVVDGTVSQEVNSSGGVLSSSLTEFNADGSVDTSFGTNGHVPIPQGFSMLIRPTDGTIVVFGAAKDGGGNATYEAIGVTSGGALDTSFGTNGVAEYPTDTTTPVADRLGDPIAGVVNGTGQIVLVGTTLGNSVRLNADGSLDTTYGQNGTANTTVTIPGGLGSTAVAAAIQPDGQVVEVANVSTGTIAVGPTGQTQAFEVAVARFGADGSLDTTYNSGGATSGVLVLPPDPANPTTLGVNVATSLAVDPISGDAVISGTDGIVTTPTAIHTVNTLYAISSSGVLDTSFGTGGEVTPEVTGQVAVQPLDGKIVDETGEGPGFATLLERFNTDGTPDATFGNYLTPGVATVSSTIGFLSSMVILPGDSIVLAGNGAIPYAGTTDLAFALAQLLPEALALSPAARPPQANPASLGANTLTSPALYEVATGTFGYDYLPGVLASGSPSITAQFGIPGAGQTIPATADYLGAGHQQIAAYLTASGTYAIQTGIGTGYSLQFGTSGTGQSIPVPADYEGTGQADIAVYLTASGSFAILPSNGSPGRIVQFGPASLGQSIPAPADYYHTGQDDLAVYLEASGAFAIQDPTGQSAGAVIPFGMPGLGKSIPVPGDYDGSGHTELAVYIPSLGAFYYRPIGGGKDVEVTLGLPNTGEVPVVGDYDGAGHDEFAVYDATNGILTYQPAGGGAAVVTRVVTPAGGSIPVAEPAGALPEFDGPGSGSGMKANVIGSPLVSDSSTPSPSTASVGVTLASVLPAGPAPGSFRVTLARANQGITDSLKFMS